jgi:nucleoside 2-deoxyribosyltransferase
MAVGEPTGRKLKIYWAGPLFSWGEREFNLRMRRELEAHGCYDVWLPQESEENQREVADMRAIAREDMEQVAECDIFLGNLDGTQVEDGTAMEAGYATAWRKIAIAHRTDFRMQGDDPVTGLNCMFLNMSEIVWVSCLKHRHEEIPRVLAERIHEAIQRHLTTHGKA